MAIQAASRDQPLVKRLDEFANELLSLSFLFFKLAGREISTLVNELKTAGNHSVSFNGNKLSSGVYFYKIEAGSFVETKRMVLVK